MSFDVRHRFDCCYICWQKRPRVRERHARSQDWESHRGLLSEAFNLSAPRSRLTRESFSTHEFCAVVLGLHYFISPYLCAHAGAYPLVTLHHNTQQSSCYRIVQSPAASLRLMSFHNLFELRTSCKYTFSPLSWDGEQRHDFPGEPAPSLSSLQKRV